MGDPLVLDDAVQLQAELDGAERLSSRARAANSKN
jgi:hypothetical protein